MVTRDNDHVGSPDADAELPEDIAALFERERRRLEELDWQPMDHDADAFQQALSRRIQSDTLRRFARNRLVIRILSTVSTLEAIALTALLIGSPPKTEEPSGTEDTIAATQEENAGELRNTVELLDFGPTEPTAPDDLGPRAPDQPQPSQTRPSSPMDPSATKPAPTVGVESPPPSRASPPQLGERSTKVPSRAKPDQCSVASTSDPVPSTVSRDAEDPKPPTNARARPASKQPVVTSIVPTPVCNKCRRTITLDFNPKPACTQCNATTEGFEQLVKARR